MNNQLIKLIEKYLRLYLELIEPKLLWKNETIPNKGGKKYYYMNNNWCNIHGQEYLDKILEVLV